MCLCLHLTDSPVWMLVDVLVNDVPEQPGWTDEDEEEEVEEKVR